MATTTMEIVSAEYSVKNNMPVIQLYGRTTEGKSVTAEIHGFTPYCYFKHNDIITPLILKECKEMILQSETVELEYMLMKEKYTKIYVKLPQNIPTIRHKYEKQTTFVSADILFPLRFIYDNNVGHFACVSGVETPNHNTYTTNLVISGGSDQTITNPGPIHCPLCIMSFDIETSLITNNILTICVYAELPSGEIQTFKLTGDEKDIIQNFINIVCQLDPDVITGYNIIFYDLPKIAERAFHYKIPVKIGRDFSAMWEKDEIWHINGRVIADAWLHTKKIKAPRRETLNYVSKKFLNEEKMDVNPKAIDDEWKESKEKVIEYCLKDAELAFKMLKYIKIIDKNVALATAAQLPLAIVFQDRTSALADALLIPMADKNHIAVPCTNRSEAEEKIEGAYVKDPEAGLYKWVIIWDFKSTYPSIMRKYNLCLTTYAPGIGEITTPTGAQFLTPDIRQGMVPKIMEKLLGDRNNFKKCLKDAKAKKEPQNVIDFWDDLQYSTKVLMNAFYGLFTSSFYRFTNRAIGESITAYARENIKAVISGLESKGYKVIYSDTDSIFITSPYENLDESVKVGKQISEEFSMGGLELDFEKVLSRWFTHGKKKRYYGHIAWPEEGEYIRGYEMRRKDSFDALTDNLENMFKDIMNDKPLEAVKIARQVITDCKKGNIPLDKLVISKSCRPENEYANPDSLPQVQCSRKLKDLGHIVAPYMSVAWIVTNSRTSPMTIEPFISQESFTHTPDWAYYANRLIDSFGRVTEVFGWDEDRLATGTVQRDLMSFS